MMHLSDTHIHLYAKDYEADRDNLIEEGMKAGVGSFFMPNIDSQSLIGLHSLAAKYPGVCYPMMGLHPCHVNDRYKEELRIIEKELRGGSYYGVGEIGLDRYWDLKYYNEQINALELQLQWASELNLPAILHTRNATEESIALIRALKLPGLKGIFHCFGGTLQHAHEIIDLGFVLGIGGVLTFKNGGLDVLMKDIPLEHIVLETDGPYLAPVPFRGKRNQPAYLRVIAEKLADLKEVDVEVVAEITTMNARRIFGL